jgi:hypothetical protein
MPNAGSSATIQRWCIYCEELVALVVGVEVAASFSVVVVAAVSVGAIVGASAASTMTMRVLVEVSPFWPVTT